MLLLLLLQLAHTALHGGTPLHGGGAVEIFTAHGEVRRVVFHGIMHLVPAEAQRRDHVGGSVRFREHVLNLIAGLDVPIRHVVLLHGGDVLLREELFRVALTGDFHNLKRHFRLKAL